MKVNKKLFVLAFILMLAAATLIVSLPAVAAQQKTQSRGFVNVSPKIVGLGQSAVINAWTTPTPPVIQGAQGSSGYGIGRPREGYTYTFIKPDGTKDVVVGGPSFGEGSAWLFYKPDKIGNWSVTLYWKGDELFTECTSPPFRFEVRAESPYTLTPDSPPTSDYWTRPINGENRLWNTIGGDWRQASCDSTQAKYNAYSVGPDSSHVLWIWHDSDWVGGLIGGAEQSMTVSTASERSSLAVGRIAMGRAYITRYDGTHCIDLKTGETYWIKTMPLGTFAATPTIDYLHNMPEYMGGEQPYANIYNFVSTTVNGSSVVQVWDPWKGETYKTIAGPGAGFNSFDEVHGYFYRYYNGSLIKWDPNKSLGMGSLGTTTGTNFTSLIVWRVAGIPAAPRHFVGDVGIVVSGGKLWRINLNDGTYTAQNTTAPSNTVLDAKTGTLFGGGTTGGLTMNYTAWDLYGNQKWISEESEYPFGFFWSYGGFSATPGLFHYAGYDGHLYAWNASTGKIQWAFYAGNSGLDTPTNTWTFWNNIVSAGTEDNIRVYAGNGEHTPAQPAWRGQQLFCVDQKTGKEVWSIAFSPLDKIVADGVLVVGNYYDGQLYAFSKGPTSTTVSAPLAAVTQGQSIMITGSVLDQSPAQLGTPCVSDEDMSAWMEYLHMQKAMPVDAKGVDVILTAVGPNGESIKVGTATSDISGNYGFQWTPPAKGTYQIMATFAGTKSYGSSYATTYVAVDPASSSPISPTPTITTPTTAPTGSTTAPTGTTTAPAVTTSPSAVIEEPKSNIDTTLYVTVAAAIIIAIIAAAAIILRKRQ